MERVFISSLARGEMGPIRSAARRAVEALDMQPIMFETGAASESDSRRALLDRVASSDALLLILGAEYGEAGDRGVSPTEEEFNEARTRGVPVLVLVQDSKREPAQEEFVTRVRGPWESGLLTASFSDVNDVGFAVTRTLHSWRRRQEGGDALASAQAKALDLARGDERAGSSYGEPKLRLVAVPLSSRPLLDAVALRDDTLIEDLAGAARESRLIPNSAGIDGGVGRDHVVLNTTGSRAVAGIVLRVGFDGSVVGEGPVGGDGIGLGGGAVMADRAREVMARSLAFAEAVWRRIDVQDEVRDVAVVCAVPDAAYKVYALEPIGNSMRMPMGLPSTVLAPEPPLRARRPDLPGTVDALQAELHRRFELEDAVHPPRANLNSWR